jgi:hypothetical protein
MVQSQHSVADFVNAFPKESKQWKEDTNSIVSVSVETEEDLIKLYNKFHKITPSVLFREPDIDNQITSIVLLGTHNVGILVITR